MFKLSVTLFLSLLLWSTNTFAVCSSYSGIISDRSTTLVRNAVVESYSTGPSTLTFYLESAEYPAATPLTCVVLNYSISYNSSTSIDENHRSNLIKAAVLSQTLGYVLNFSVGANATSPVLHSLSTVTVIKP